MTDDSNELGCFMDRNYYLCNTTASAVINYTANAEIYAQYDERKVWLN